MVLGASFRCGRLGYHFRVMAHEPLHIVRYPHPVLARKAGLIGEIDDRVRVLAARMIESMYQAEGVGLAAPQVGESIRMFVADPREADTPEPTVFIDPVLETSGDLLPFEEGCLSIPDVRVMVRRPQSVRITATNLDGERFTLENDDFPARVWQHEFDHLDGVLIVDRMSPKDRLVHRRTLKEMRAAFETSNGV